MSRKRVDAGGFTLVCRSWAAPWRWGELAGELDLWDPDKQQVVGNVHKHPNNYIYDAEPDSDDNAEFQLGFMEMNLPVSSIVSLDRRGVSYLGIAGKQRGTQQEVIYAAYRRDNLLRDDPSGLAHHDGETT